MSHFTSNPRTEASRRNGAKSKGPITTDGKTRASKNALKHGLRATSTVLLDGEDEAAFEVLSQGLKADLQPCGALEDLLASRLAIAAWRMSRADQIEAELLTSGNNGQAATLGEKVTRDRHGPQAIDCLLRYRGSTQTEFWRALTALRAVQSQREEGSLMEMPRPTTLPTDVIHPEYVELNVAESNIDESVKRLQPNEPDRP